MIIFLSNIAIFKLEGYPEDMSAAEAKGLFNNFKLKRICTEI